jgi:anti-anti-sigma factor
MPVRVHARTRVLVIGLSGDMDMVSRPLLDAAVDSAIRGTWPVVVVDAGELRFLDGAGAAPLDRLSASIPLTRRLLVVNAGPRVVETLSALGLGDHCVGVEELPLACDEEWAELSDRQ